MGSSTNGRSRRAGVRRRRGSSPRLPDRPTVPQVAVLIERLYKMDKCSIGGPLHIVTEDGNLEDGHLRWIRDEGAWMSERIWPDEAAALGQKIADLMLQMTGTQRRKLAGRSYYDWI